MKKKTLINNCIDLIQTAQLCCICTLDNLQSLSVNKQQQYCQGELHLYKFYDKVSLFRKIIFISLTVSRALITMIHNHSGLLDSCHRKFYIIILATFGRSFAKRMFQLAQLPFLVVLDVLVLCQDPMDHYRQNAHPLILQPPKFMKNRMTKQVS